MFNDFSAAVSDNVNDLMIENYYEEENRKCMRFLTVKQDKVLKQENVNALANQIVGVKRRFAVARLYRCVLEDWVEIDIGILFLVETWDCVFLVLMSLKKRREVWKIGLIGENGAVAPIQVQETRSFLTVQGPSHIYGLSFASLYNVTDFATPMKHLIERVRQVLKNRQKKGLLATISNLFKLSESTFRTNPPEPPERRPRRVLVKKPKKRRNTLVLNPAWRKYLIETVGMKEEELVDEKVVRRVVEVVKVMNRKNKRRKPSEEEQNGREEETEGEEEEEKEEKEEVKLPHEKKAEDEKMDQKLLQEREEEIDRLKGLIKKISLTEKKRVRLYQRKIRSLERTASFFRKKAQEPSVNKSQPSPSSPSAEIQAGPVVAPPKPPSERGYQNFLKRKNAKAVIRKEQREASLPPPPGKNESGGFLQAIADEIADRRIRMMGFREDDSDEEDEDSDGEGDDEWFSGDN